jgi:UDP-N-acetylglucosamine 2-epimerase (non-hydrolysing)
MTKKILIVVDTRPEAIKIASVIRELRKVRELSASVLNSGQHRNLLLPPME